MTQVQQERVSVEEFFTLPETTQKTELLNGDIIVSPSARTRHQKAVVRLLRLISDAVESGEVLVAPMDVRLGDDVVQPDVFYVAEDGQATDEDTHWSGAPDFIAEVLSPSTAKRDRDEKFTLYQTHGVREYWLVDPNAQFIEVYALVEAAFVRQGVFGVGEHFTSALFAAEFSAGEVFTDG